MLLLKHAPPPSITTPNGVYCTRAYYAILRTPPALHIRLLDSTAQNFASTGLTSCTTHTAVRNTHTYNRVSTVYH
jgi:hypothetical protein